MKLFVAILLLSSAAWAQQMHPDGLDTVREACNAMEPSNRAKVEACQYVARMTPAPSTEPGCIHYAPGQKHYLNVPACAPLKCGKYEHATLDCREALDGFVATNASFTCTVVRHCAPDLHTVTEKEWQETQKRMREMQHDLDALIGALTSKDVVEKLKSIEHRK